MDQTVVPFDLHRMFFGADPPLFYLDFAVRCVIIYGYTLLLLRWIGGRSVMQMSLVEFLLVIALGSAVGDALFYPEVPLVHAMVAITAVVLINKSIDAAILRWDMAKRIVDGDPVKLLEDGHILSTSTHHRTMGRSELMAALRVKGIRNLGELAAVYMEPSGSLSLYRRDRAMPGLEIAPPHELVAPDTAVGQAMLCCSACGLVISEKVVSGHCRCPECGNTGWTVPVAPRGPGLKPGCAP